MNVTAYADQYHAAARDAYTRLDFVSPNRAVHVLSDPWLSSEIATIRAAMEAGETTVCPHLTGHPEVVHTALWAPATLVCERCLLMLSTATAAEDSTCDRCRQQAPAISQGMLALGPVILHMGLCTPCVNASSLYRAALTGSGPGSATGTGSGGATSRATGRKRPASRNRRG